MTNGFSLKDFPETSITYNYQCLMHRIIGLEPDNTR